jgi:heme a synthase
MIRRLALVLFALTTIVVVLGAYVRLSDAGLGCPDWPGCYGELTPHHAADEIIAEHKANPGGPVSMAKAWKEMIHRYLASGIGILIIAVCVLAWRRRAAFGLPLAAFALVCVQGAFGAWTVTMLLRPVVVSTHLLLGMSLLALVCWLAIREWHVSRHPVASVAPLRIGLALLFVQIALGGWVSTNYAALACLDFPTCGGTWMPHALNFADGFSLVRELGLTADGAPLPLEAMQAIQWVHRLGAVLIGGYLMGLGLHLARTSALRRASVLLVGLVILQIVLGIANVLMKLPVALAVAHNAVAALLVISMVWLNYCAQPIETGFKENARERLST